MGGWSHGAKGSSKGKGPQVRFTDWLCDCGYRNFGRQATCRECYAIPPAGARRPKGAGKGGGGSTGSSVGGIAERQLRQQAEAEREAQKKVLEKMRLEHQKTVEKLHRQVEAARRGEAGPVEVELEDEDDDDEECDADKEQNLLNELRQTEQFARSLEGSSPFKETAKARAEAIQKELEHVRERRGGPEAKILGRAGRYAKELRNARQKLLRKTKAQNRLEEEETELEKKVEELQNKLNEKRKELEETKGEVQKAKTELERLSKASEEECDDKKKSDNDDEPKGPKERASLLAGQLSSYLPPHFKTQLEAIMGEAIKEVEQRTRPEGGGAAAGEGTPLAPPGPAKPPTPAENGQQKEEEGKGKEEGGDEGNDSKDDMEDLAKTTVELLDTILGAAGEEEPGGEKSKLLRSIRSKGATASNIRRVIKSYNKDKNSENANKGSNKAQQ